MVGTVGMAVTVAVTANEVRMAKKRAQRRAALRTPDQTTSIERLSLDAIRPGLNPRYAKTWTTQPNSLKEQQTC